MKLRQSLLALLVSAALLPAASNAAPMNWAWNYSGLNAAEGYAGGIMGPVSATMDELKFTGESLIHWTSGVPFATGSTFDDYILLRVDQFFLGNANATDITYGAGFPGKGFPGDHEFTEKIKLTGTQTGVNTYSLTGMSEFGLYYNAGVGASYTLADFAAPGTFVDGTLAESGIFVAGNGTNTSSGLPDGSIGLVVALLDELHLVNIAYGTTELLPNCQGYHPIPVAIGLADGNNNLCGAAACTGSKAGLKSFFGIDAGVNDALLVHTKTDGSFSKTVFVPEPGTLALMGGALLGLAAVRRRRAGKTQN